MWQLHDDVVLGYNGGKLQVRVCDGAAWTLLANKALLYVGRERVAPQVWLWWSLWLWVEINPAHTFPTRIAGSVREWCPRVRFANMGWAALELLV